MKRCDQIGYLELVGSPSDGCLWGNDTINSSSNRNKCPPPLIQCKRSSKPSQRQDMLDLSKLAIKANLHDLARKFEYCCTDFIVLRGLGGQLSATPLRCDHKLCPLCHAYHAQKIRSRLEEVIHRANLFITLTIATYKDHELRENIEVLKRAFRLMTQRKKKKQWIPFESGYFWRLEITEGKGFHPHFHILSTHSWIDYDHLRYRWRQCVDHAGGKGDIIWIDRTEKDTLYEVSKYLSKDIDLINWRRWPELNRGLWHMRTYGSGRALRLPPLEDRGKKFVCFGKDIDHLSDRDLIDFVRKKEPHGIIRPDSIFKPRYSDPQKFQDFYGYPYEDDWL